MFRYITSLVLVTFCSASTKLTETCTQPKISPQWPVGDYHNCLVDDSLPYRLEVLPGLGWDNLLNRVSGMVSLRNYSQCRTTEDGHYLIPDDVFVTPYKESQAALSSELIDHWSNYSSMTSNTINVEAHASFGFGSISGSYSSEHQEVKKQQVENKAITSRVQLRLRIYSVHLQPDPQLHPKFKTRLLDIGSHLQLKNKPVARYLAGILIRDYGTHYVTRTDAGGVLAELDQIKREYVASSDETTQKTKASASASFFGHFGVSASTSHLNTQKVSSTYTSNVVDTKVHTLGGEPIRENFTLAHWEDSLRNNLVAIDRQGDPLHYLITLEALPELPEEVIFELSSLVLKSIQRYYKHNAIQGCIDAESPNFNFQANLDDGSCKAASTNFTFGGVYQTCARTGSPPSDPCVGWSQTNPKTGTFSCPPQYEAILLHQGTLAEHCQRHCHGWWIFKSCDTQCGGGTYSTYWCVAEGKVHQQSGYMFGGLYSDTTNNMVTGAKECPAKFIAQRFGPKGMYVCVSDDYELGAKFSLPFAGFMSCSAGNPLARTGSSKEDTNPSTMPKQCPHGYSQHLAVIDEDCEITYCTKTGLFTSKGLPPIRRPPFHDKPRHNDAITFPLLIENNDTSKVYMRNENSGQWLELTASMSVNMAKKASTINPSYRAVKNLRLAMEALDQAQSSERSSSAGLSGGATAAISVGVTVFVGIVVIAIFVKRRRNHTPLNENRSNYQSFTS